MLEEVPEGGLVEVEFPPAASREIDDEGWRVVDFGNLVEDVEGVQLAVLVYEQRRLLQVARHQRKHH
jgi:hypothetical protein